MWYARPVFFVADVNRAARFYVEVLGFRKHWHSDEGAGTVCQVNRSGCEIILCEDASRHDKARLFLKLIAGSWLVCRKRSLPTRFPSKDVVGIRLDPGPRS